MYTLFRTASFRTFHSLTLIFTSGGVEKGGGGVGVVFFALVSWFCFFFLRVCRVCGLFLVLGGGGGGGGGVETVCYALVSMIIVF